MPSLDSVLGRLEAAVDCLEAVADGWLSRERAIGSMPVAGSLAPPATEAVLDDLGERLDRTIARLRAALGD